MEFSGVRRFMAQPPLERKVMRLETRMANCGFCKLQDNCPGMNDCVHWSEDAQRYNWLRSRQKLDLRSDCTKWTRKDGTRFTASHYLAEGDMRHGPAETLDETIDAAMERENLHLAREARTWWEAAQTYAKQAQRTPLDPLDVEELWDRANADDAADEVHHAFARLLERAHGIGAEHG